MVMIATILPKVPLAPAATPEAIIPTAILLTILSKKGQ